MSKFNVISAMAFGLITITASISSAHAGCPFARAFMERNGGYRDASSVACSDARGWRKAYKDSGFPIRHISQQLKK